MRQPVALVTGASAGIGLETALGLARAGFRVIITGRDGGRIEAARRAVAERSGASSVETVLADFASLAAVRQLAERVLAAHDRLDLLVNNAGLIAPRYRLSEDGYELTIAVNHLAPFLLTNLLLDRLRVSAPARLFTRALARRLAGSGVVASCLHPGVVATAIGDRAGRIAGWGWRLAKPFLVSPTKGAETSLFLAATPDATAFHGIYLIGRAAAQPDPAELDDDLAERLWRDSLRLVGLPE